MFLRSRALDVRDLVRVGKLSRAVTRADAARLATPSPSTISTLVQLHPNIIYTQTPDTSSTPRIDIVPPPLNPPANPLCDLLIVQIMLKKLPLSTRLPQTMVGISANMST